MLRILVANAKGGCGKTMLATNLAAAYAHGGHATVLVDCDPLAASERWYARRVAGLPGLAVQPMLPTRFGAPALWSLCIPPRTQVLVIDAPAGCEGAQLGELLRRCDHLLVPCLPSALDLAVTLDYLDRLSRLHEMRHGGPRVGIVANRLRANTLGSRELAAQLASSPWPLVATVRDSQMFVQASAIGRGLLEFGTRRCQEHAEGIRQLMAWLPAPPAPAAPGAGPGRAESPHGAVAATAAVR
ncbi:MAG: ParA family protein [Pseudoxanthomonas sp.]|nr:ParA family protein [Pseudoxanthomonas sp.]